MERVRLNGTKRKVHILEQNKFYFKELVNYVESENKSKSKMKMKAVMN